MPLGGIAFEAALTRDQAQRLATLMVEARPTRPEGVLTASLEYDDGRARLVAIWRDEQALSDYLPGRSSAAGHGAHASGRGRARGE